MFMTGFSHVSERIQQKIVVVAFCVVIHSDKAVNLLDRFKSRMNFSISNRLVYALNEQTQAHTVAGFHFQGFAFVFLLLLMKQIKPTLLYNNKILSYRCGWERKRLRNQMTGWVLWCTTLNNRYNAQSGKKNWIDKKEPKKLLTLKLRIPTPGRALSDL